MHKLMIFIDGSNLYHETDRFQKGMRVDFEKLRAAGGFITGELGRQPVSKVALALAGKDTYP